MRSLNDSVAFFPPLAYLPVVAAILVCGCDVAQQPSLQAVAKQTVLNVNVIEVTEDQNALRTFIVFGKLKPARQSQLGFARGGRVKAVLKQLGDQLEVGDKLAELDNAQLENQKQSAESTLAKLKNDLQAAQGNAVSTVNRQIAQVEKQLKELDLEIANGVIAAPYPSLVVQRSRWSSVRSEGQLRKWRST